MTSAVEEVRFLLEDRFRSVYAQPNEAAVAWPNVDFDPPVAWDPDIPISSMWFAVSHQIDSRASASFGNGDGKGRVRMRGALVVQIFALADTGIGHSMRAARDILDAFDGVTITTVSRYRLQMQVGGASTIGSNNGYWQTNVELPWYCDEIPNPLPPDPDPDTTQAEDPPSDTSDPDEGNETP